MDEDAAASERKRQRALMPVRITRLKDDHDAFDRSYFASLSPARKMELVAEMFAEQWLSKGGDEEQLRLRRFIARLQRGKS